MSRTDKTRPYWVRLGDQPMVTCVPQHDHRFGPCTLPEIVTAAAGDRRTRGCRWLPSPHLRQTRLDRGGREWQEHRHASTRRARRQSRLTLRHYRYDD